MRLPCPRCRYVLISEADPDETLDDMRDHLRYHARDRAAREFLLTVALALSLAADEEAS